MLPYLKVRYELYSPQMLERILKVKRDKKEEGFMEM